jgi:lipoyl(octanoyl) transferase
MYSETITEGNKHLIYIKSNQLVDLTTYDSDVILNYILSQSDNQVNYYWLGRFDYHKAWSLQKEIQDQVINHQLNNVVLFLEHESVYTLGKNANSDNLLPTIPKGMEVVQTDRGGDVTYHGPGQLVGYPIIDLKKYRKSITWFMRGLEKSIIHMLEKLDISSSIKDGLTGVWVDDDKIAALGVRLSRWVSMHGFAINVYTDLSLFRGMIPCGISDFGITSISKLKDNQYDLQSIAKLVILDIEKMLHDEKIKKVGHV